MARILVVDDDQAVRLLLRTMLERRGHSVVEAENGDEGLRYYWATPTDLVITDIEMPGEGWSADDERTARRLSHSQDYCHLWGQGSLAAAQTFSQCTFAKPLDMEEFLDAVQEFASAPKSSLYMLQPRTLGAVDSVQGDA